jgi:hypothetical protein
MTARTLRLGLVDAEVLESNRGEDIGVCFIREGSQAISLKLQAHANRKVALTE